MKNVSNKFAIIRISGKQYRVSEGDEILVDKLKDAKKVEPEVLLIADEKEIKVGTPKVLGAKVKLKVINETEKGEKVRVFKYKAKSRYRKLRGFRAQYTKLLVEKIS